MTPPNDRRSRRQQRREEKLRQQQSPHPPQQGHVAEPPSSPAPSASTAYSRASLVGAPAAQDGPAGRTVSLPAAASGEVSPPGMVAASAAAKIDEDPSSFVRLTIMFEDRRGDLLLPGGVPLAELLPSLVRRFTTVTPRSVTRGYVLVGMDGKAMAPGRTLFDHGVTDGTILSLSSRVLEREKKYDDIVEAVADAAAEMNRPWTPEHTANTAVAAAVVLVIAALLMMVQVRDEVGIAIPIMTGTLAALHLGLAWVLDRMGRSWHAVTIALLASAAAGVTGLLAIDAPRDELPAVFGGLAAMLVAGLAMPLLRQWRELLVIPIAVGAVVAIIGGLYIAFDVDIPRVAVTIAGLTGIAILAVPQMAMRMSGLEREQEKVDTGETRRLYTRGHRLMIAFWVSAALILLIVAVPSVQTNAFGIAVMALNAILLAMSSRRSYARAGVLIQYVGALAVFVLTAAAVVVTSPQWWPFVIVALLLIVIGAVAFGLVLERTWPWMRRAADIIEPAAIISLIPATVLALELW